MKFLLYAIELSGGLKYSLSLAAGLTQSGPLPPGLSGIAALNPMLSNVMVTNPALVGLMSGNINAAEVPIQEGWVKLRGIPFNISKAEIIRFFEVTLCLPTKGATQFVAFVSQPAISHWTLEVGCKFLSTTFPHMAKCDTYMYWWYVQF